MSRGDRRAVAFEAQLDDLAVAEVQPRTQDRVLAAGLVHGAGTFDSGGGGWFDGFVWQAISLLWSRRRQRKAEARFTAVTGLPNDLVLAATPTHVLVFEGRRRGLASGLLAGRCPFEVGAQKVAWPRQAMEAKRHKHRGSVRLVIGLPGMVPVELDAEGAPGLVGELTRPGTA